MGLAASRENERSLEARLLQSELRLAQMRAHYNQFRREVQARDRQLRSPLAADNMSYCDDFASSAGQDDSAESIKRTVHSRRYPDSPDTLKRCAEDSRATSGDGIGADPVDKREDSRVHSNLRADAFGFFGASVAIFAEDKTRVTEGAQIQEWKARLVQAEQEKEFALSEHKIIKEFLDEIRLQADARQEQIVQLRQQVQSLEARRQKEVAEWREKYEVDVDVLTTKMSNQLRDCKQIFACEVEVLHHICGRQQEEVDETRVSMKQM